MAQHDIATPMAPEQTAEREPVIESITCSCIGDTEGIEASCHTEHASSSSTEDASADRGDQTGTTFNISANIWDICIQLRAKSGLLGKAVVLVSFIVTAVALWPTFSGAVDSRRSKLLAEWTAKKDFFEFCESVCGTHQHLVVLKLDLLTFVGVIIARLANGWLQ